jgi:hypothetical protein
MILFLVGFLFGAVVMYGCLALSDLPFLQECSRLIADARKLNDDTASYFKGRSA